jgi:hypothetical protein
VNGDLLAAYRALQPEAQVLAGLLHGQSLHVRRIVYRSTRNKSAKPRSTNQEGLEGSRCRRESRQL